MNTGDICYLADGRKAEYRERLRVGHLVTLMGYVWSDLEDTQVEVAGEIVVADQVFREPPAPAYHEEIAKLEEKLRALQKGVATIQRRHAEADAARRAALRALSLVPDGDQKDWTYIVDLTKATLEGHPDYHVIRDRRTNKIVAMCAISEDLPICEGQFSFAPIVQRVLEHHLAATAAGIISDGETS